MKTIEIKARATARAMGALAATGALAPAMALADAQGGNGGANNNMNVDAAGALSDVMGVISRGVQFVGVVMIFWGLVQVGIMIRSEGGAGGGQIVNAILTIVSGVVITVAGTYFSTIGTAWVNS